MCPVKTDKIKSEPMKEYLRTPFSPILFLLATMAMLGTAPNNLIAQTIEKRLIDEMEFNGAVGLAVAVVRDNAIVYKKSFGFKDLEAGIPLEVDDIFRIASISKSFSATAVMQLLEQGKLSLDDEVGDLVGFPVRNPKYPEVPITLRMLLSHTSSLTDSEGYFTLDVINPEVNADWGKSYADYAPGEKYQYCNLGFNTIGAIIERLSGQRFDKYIVEHILDPLNLYGGYHVDSLDSTRIAQIYYIDSETGKFTRSSAYRPLGNRLDDYKMGYSAPIFSPTGGMKISAPDLARYMMMHMNHGSLDGVQIMEGEHSKAMQRPLAWMDAKRDYGFALHHDRGSMVPGVDLIGHTGDAYGLNSVMMFDPQKKFGMVVITNGFRPSDPSFQSRIMSVLYDHFIERAPREGSKTKKDPVQRFSLILGGQKKTGSSGNFVDMKKGEVMQLEEATENQSRVDLLYAHGESSGANLMLPASESLRYFGEPGLESVSYNWVHKNRGSLIALKGSPENGRLFEKIGNDRQLDKAYGKALKRVGDREGYKRWVHGPNARVSNLEVGDIVFLLVNSRERGILSLVGPDQREILAIGKVKRIVGGPDGEMEIEFKTAVGE